MFVSPCWRCSLRTPGRCRFRGLASNRRKAIVLRIKNAPAQRLSVLARKLPVTREFLPCYARIFSCYGPVPRKKTPSHGVVPVKLIRLRRPLACHPRSGAKRSGAGSEATLTRQRPDTLSRASAELDPMLLAVVEADRLDVGEAVERPGEAHRRILPAGQEDIGVNITLASWNHL